MPYKVYFEPIGMYLRLNVDKSEHLGYNEGMDDKPHTREVSIAREPARMRSKPILIGLAILVVGGLVHEQISTLDLSSYTYGAFTGVVSVFSIAYSLTEKVRVLELDE